jgi:hypothetical protein
MDPPIPQPDPLFDAIGRVAAAWAELEFDLAELLTAVVHAPVAKLFFIGQSYQVLSGHLRGVVKLIDAASALQQYDQPRERLSDEMRDHIKNALKEIDRLADDRHQIVHGAVAIRRRFGACME